ncbi:flagellar hook protein FlgE [Pleionea mediterranea]|uniref:Flagellar hook protein FlgE n=1 Tax=Pleionea mediterranea TaxID=523701 RepID=A0A316G455_9GAMM|nr:flagellar hook protein FlgE [Pleionea mediterranea]PWK49187.1 flagellar hook protein FlgE [Pleionea mediterranea]
MSFNTALSGLNAAQADLNVTSNNIANVSTTGFKFSRAEFGDIFATSTLGSSKTAIGNGVILGNVAQQFGQGNLEFTSNTLDLAVSGQGFFVLEPSQNNQNQIFTRAGEFGVDNNGFVVNNAGARLQAFPTNSDGTVTATALSSTQPLQIPQSAGSPTSTTEIDIGVNLPANATGLNVNAFDPNSPSTFSASTSSTIFDSLGESHIATVYYVKDAGAPNQWASYYFVDGNPVDITGGTAGANGQLYHTVEFDAAGNFQQTVPANPSTAALGFTNGSNAAQTIALDYANNAPTQFASPFTVNTLDQNGATIGRLAGIEIGESGVVRANFTNGQSNSIGKIALVRFPNPQGLAQLGNNAWSDTIDSGQPLAGEALTSSFGQIRSGALETSNVDLTSELVNLITAQRNFQANARTIETNNQVTQTIIQIR